MLYSLSVGRFTASQPDAVCQPSGTFPDRGPVVFCHGTESSGVDGVAQVNATTVTSGVRAVVRALTAAGFTIVVPAAPNLWGGTTGQARVAGAITHARNVLGASGPAVLVGYSQGGMAALRYAMTNPSEVAAVVGLLPATDLDYIRDNDIAGQRDDIDTIYGVTYPAALPTGVNPADNTGDFDLPMAFWYASDDAMVSAAATTTFASATGAEVHNVGALGHTDAALLAVDTAAVTTFVEEYA